MSKLWKMFAGLGPQPEGEGQWTLADSFGVHTFTRRGAALCVPDAPPLRTGAALSAHLMPRTGLNAACLTGGLVLTPLGVMQFNIGSVKDRWSGEWHYRMALHTPPEASGVARPYGYLEIITYDVPPGMTGSPYRVMQDGRAGVDPTPGLRRAMAAVQAAAWLALATPDTLYAVRTRDLEADLAEALADAAQASAHVDRWKAA